MEITWDAKGQQHSYLWHANAKIDDAVGLGDLQHGSVGDYATLIHLHGLYVRGRRSDIASQGRIVRGRSQCLTVLFQRRHHHLDIHSLPHACMHVFLTPLMNLL